MPNESDLTEARSNLVQFERTVCFGGGRHRNKAVRTWGRRVVASQTEGKWEVQDEN